MIRRASVGDVKSGKVSRENVYVVIAMRFFPRFFKKELMDEYAHVLAPQADLFKNFKSLQKTLKNHNVAFFKANYESHFDLSRQGRKHLSELATASLTRDMALICQCKDFERCHCDLLLIWARSKYSALVSGLIFDYPVFEARLSSGELDQPK